MTNSSLESKSSDPHNSALFNTPMLMQLHIRVRFCSLRLSGIAPVGKRRSYNVGISSTEFCPVPRKNIENPEVSFFASLQKYFNAPYLETDSLERNLLWNSQRELKLAALSGWLWKGQNCKYSFCPGHCNPQKHLVLTQTQCVHHHTLTEWNFSQDHLNLLNIQKSMVGVRCFSVLSSYEKKDIESWVTLQ